MLRVLIALLSTLLHSSDTFNIQTAVTEQSLSTSSTDHCLLIAPDIVVNSSTPIDEMKIAISENYISSEDSLTYDNSISPITGIWNSSKGILTLSGTASGEKYQEAIRKVQYCNSGNPPTVAKRSIDIYVSNGKYYNPENGHYYEKRCVGSSIRWTEARPEAEANYFFSIQGYLATITEDSENSFIQEKVGGDYAWIGTTDAEVEGVWRWKTGPEGLEDGGKGRHFFTQTKHNRSKCPCSSRPSLMPTDSCQTYTDSSGIPLIAGDGGGEAVNGEYNFWRRNEPNSWTCNEDYGHFYINREWNDYPDKLNVKCFIIEYGGMPTDPDPDIENINLKTEIKIKVVADSISSEIDYLCAFSSAVSVFEPSEYVDLDGGQCNTRIEYFGISSVTGLNVANNNIKQPVDCTTICNGSSCNSSNEYAVPINLPDFPSNGATKDYTYNSGSKTLKTSRSNQRNVDRVFVRNGAELYLKQDSRYDFKIKTLKASACNGKGVTFEPGNYFIENLDFESRCNFFVSGTGDGSGTARLFVKNGININSNTDVNWNGSKESSDSKKIMFISYEGDVNIASDVEMAGLIYSENHSVNMASRSTLSGAITAHQINIEDDVDIFSTDLTPDQCDSYETDTPSTQFQFDTRDLNIVSDTNFSITTKVVNRDFGLQIVAFDENRVRKAYSGTVNLKTTQPDEVPLGSCSFNSSETCNTETNLTVPIAVKDSRVVITEVSTSKEFNSSDNFAIRPKNFYINPVSSPQIADINFTLNIDVRDEVGDITAYQYSEQLSDLNLSTTQKTSCIDENLSGLSGGSFENGVLSKSVNYPEVGEVKIEITEKVGSEYAIVDKNDTNEDQRLIEPDDINVTFDIAKYRVSGTLVDHYSDSNFTYYAKESNLTEMSAELELLFESLGGDGNITLNYDVDCYERNLTELQLSFEWNSSINSHLIGNSDFNISGTELSIQNISFQSGTNSTILTLNLDRNVSSPKNSDTLSIEKAVEDFGNYTTDKNLSGVAHFYYGRVQAPNYRFKGRDGNFTLYSEIWSDQDDRNSSVFGDRFIDLNWYENLIMDISGLSAEVESSVKSITVNGRTAEYSTGSLPYRNILNISVPEWLVYNRFVEDAVYNYFSVEFYCDDSLDECEEKIIEDSSADEQKSAKYKDRRIEW